MLSQNDKTEIREMMQEGIDKIEVRTDNKFEIIHLKLEQILEQTTKHNNRMSKAESRLNSVEKNEITHELNCPMIEKVRALEDDNLTNKGVKKVVSRSVAITGGGMTIIWIAFQLISKILGS